MKYQLNGNNLRALVRKSISESLGEGWDDWDDDEDNEPTEWEKYVSNYDNDPYCPFNKFSEGMEYEQLEELLKYCFNNEFLFYHQGRWSAANTKGIQCAIMSDIANDPSVGATHEADGELESRLSDEMSYGRQFGVIKVSSKDGVYYVVYED